MRTLRKSRKLRTLNKFLLVVLAGLLLGGTAFGQKYTDVLLNQKVTVNYDDHTVTAYLKPASVITTESGLFYTWFSGHQIRVTQGGYSGRLLNGLYQDFYGNKNLKEAGMYTDGLKDGIWKSWNEAGVLKEELTWSQGEKDGYYIRYTEAGLPAEKGNYAQGLLQGKQLTYPGIKTTTGVDSVVVVHYRKGKVVPPESLFPKNILPKHVVPEFIKRQFKKKAKN